MIEFLTPSGQEKILKQLQELKEKKPLTADRIRQAKELGDLSENAEYTTAKEELAYTEREILRLEGLLRSAEIVDRHTESDQISIGSKVILKIKQETKTYTLVGSEESDPGQGLISYQSPLGQALIGKKVGEKTSIKTPSSEFMAEIIEIE